MKLTKLNLRELIAEEIVKEEYKDQSFSKTGTKIYMLNIKSIVGELQHLKYSLEKNNPVLFMEVITKLQNNLKMMSKNFKKYLEK